MTNLLRNAAIIGIGLLVFACSQKSFDAGSKTKIRIVDLEGKPHSVRMRTPELNVQALAAQGNITETQVANQAKPINTSANSGNKYVQEVNASSYEAIKNTLEMPQVNAQAAKEVKYNPEMAEAGNVVKNKKEEVVEYTLTKNEPTQILNESPKSEGGSSKKQKGIFVQTGSFTVMSHAKKSLATTKKYAAKNNTKIEEGVSGDKTVYRVLIGPFTSKAQAQAMVSKLHNAKQQAIIVNNK